MKNFVAPLVICRRIGCFECRASSQHPLFSIALHISLILESFEMFDIGFSPFCWLFLMFLVSDVFKIVFLSVIFG